MDPFMQEGSAQRHNDISVIVPLGDYTTSTLPPGNQASGTAPAQNTQSPLRTLPCRQNSVPIANALEARLPEKDYLGNSGKPFISIQSISLGLYRFVPHLLNITMAIVSYLIHRYRGS